VRRDDGTPSAQIELPQVEAATRRGVGWPDARLAGLEDGENGRRAERHEIPGGTEHDPPLHAAASVSHLFDRRAEDEGAHEDHGEQERQLRCGPWVAEPAPLCPQPEADPGEERGEAEWDAEVGAEYGQDVVVRPGDLGIVAPGGADGDRQEPGHVTEQADRDEDVRGQQRPARP
jgi:hypothetical protein